MQNKGSDNKDERERENENFEGDKDKILISNKKV